MGYILSFQAMRSANAVTRLGIGTHKCLLDFAFLRFIPSAEYYLECPGSIGGKYRGPEGYG